MPSPVKRCSGKDDVPGLLAAERQPALDHLFHHVLVADRASDHLDAALAQGELETDVAHHRRDDAVAEQLAPGLHVTGAHQQHCVAVDDAALGIDQDGAVAVAVERHTDTARLLDHRALQVLRMRRAAIEIDVAAVGRRAQQVDVEAQLLEQPRRHRRRRAVRGVDGDPEAAEPLRLRQRQAGVRDVGVDDVSAFDRNVRGAADAPALVGDDRFDLALERFAELLAAPGEHLDAVVLERIVRGRDDQAGVVAHLAGDVGDGRRRQHPGGGDVCAFRAHAARELALDPLAGFPRIAPGDEAQLPAFGAHRAHQRRAEPRYGLVIERKLARLSANAISTEESVGHK